MITEIQIVKLPYQEHPFVCGVRDGEDVWLTNEGEWTTDELSEKIPIPFAK